MYEVHWKNFVFSINDQMDWLKATKFGLHTYYTREIQA